MSSAEPEPSVPVLRLEAWNGPIADDDPDARLAAYHRLAGMLSWLAAPLDPH